MQIAEAFKDKTLVITGGTGSFGSTVLKHFLTTDIGEIYQAGSYYEYVKRFIEVSLEHYLTDTSFPLTVSLGKGGPSAVFQTAQDYIDALNANGKWVYYDVETGKVSISSIHDFTTRLKRASKPVAAFDKIETGGHELFNTGDGECTGSMHAFRRRSGGNRKGDSVCPFPGQCMYQIAG